MRYAIYLTPPWESGLADAARQWLGRCAFSGKTLAAQAPEQALSHVPARYGFHATMRAPFRLADGFDEAALVKALKAFAARQGAIEVPLHVSRLGNFVALTSEENALLGEAAMAALRAFEPYRAPLTEAERARRNPDALDARGRDLLDRWGYPYVEERFKFHMTLSGPMTEATDSVEAAARDHFARFINGTPQSLEFALFAEHEPQGPFSVLWASEG